MERGWAQSTGNGILTMYWGSVGLMGRLRKKCLSFSHQHRKPNVNWISSLSESDRLEIQLTFGSRCWWLNERHFSGKRPIEPTDPQYIVGSSSSQPSGTKSGTKSIPNNELRFGASANMRNQVEPNQEPNQFPIMSWDFAFLPTCGTKWNQGRNQVNSQ